MYSSLAAWFHLITAPEDYEEEAAFFVKHLTDACDRPPETVVELGSGGGNNASHMTGLPTIRPSSKKPSGKSQTARRKRAIPSGA